MPQLQCILGWRDQWKFSPFSEGHFKSLAQPLANYACRYVCIIIMICLKPWTEYSFTQEFFEIMQYIFHWLDHAIYPQVMAHTKRWQDERSWTHSKQYTLKTHWHHDWNIYIYIYVYIYDVSGLMHLVVTQVHVLSHLPWSKEITFTSRYVQHGNTVIHENSMHVIRQIIFYDREKWFIKAHTTSLDWVASSRRERLCWRRLGATVGTDDSRGHACRTRPRATHIHE